MRTNWKKKYLELVSNFTAAREALRVAFERERRMHEALTNNNVTITELQNQVAVQASIRHRSISEVEHRQVQEALRMANDKIVRLLRDQAELLEQLRRPWYVKFWDAAVRWAR